MGYTPHTPQASAPHTPHTPTMAAPHTPHTPHGPGSPHSPYHEEHERQHKIDEEYCTQQRAAAEAKYERRHQLMEQQKQLWDSGDKAGAKKLSEEAKHLGEEAEKLEFLAAENIFKYKNSPSRQPPDYIDLHGLHVQEALRFLKLRIQSVREQKKPVLIVIYGAGNHSKNHKQLIKPSVMEYLSSQKDFSLHEDYDDITGHSNPGCVTVKYTGAIGAPIGSGSGAALDIRSPVSTSTGSTGSSVSIQKEVPRPVTSAPKPVPVAPPKEDSCMSCCIIM